MSQITWPLEGICLKTIIKIEAFNIFHHEGEHSYYQISIDGFVLSSFGDVTLANIQINIEEDDAAKVDCMVEKYKPDTIHWLESSDLGITKGEYHFYHSTMTAIDANLKTTILEFFPDRVAHDHEAQHGEFMYVGTVYAPGKGEIAFR